MIKSERYGGGHRWYCTDCDVTTGFYARPTISWVNSTPPEFCSKCIMKNPHSLLMKLKMTLAAKHGDKFVLPGSVRIITNLIKDGNYSWVPKDVSPSRLAAMLNQANS
jgi:hypothetical protein